MKFTAQKLSRQFHTLREETTYSFGIPLRDFTVSTIYKILTLGRIFFFFPEMRPPETAPGKECKASLSNSECFMPQSPHVVMATEGRGYLGGVKEKSLL